MIAYIDKHRGDYGVEPICSVLQFGPRTYYAAKARPPSVRAVRDADEAGDLSRPPSGVVDGSGTTEELFKYSPYGTQSCASSSCMLYEPIQCAGGYNDAADGNESLVKFGQRYYDPSTGRWTQHDPVDNPLDLQGWNQYDYAGDDPVNNVDPCGLAPQALPSCRKINCNYANRYKLCRGDNGRIYKCLRSIHTGEWQWEEEGEWPPHPSPDGKCRLTIFGWVCGV